MSDRRKTPLARRLLAALPKKIRFQMMRDQQRRKPRQRVYAPRVRAADSTANPTSKEAPITTSETESEGKPIIPLITPK